MPELLDLATLLEGWRISRDQLVDLALLVGTDFNEGVKGIGPKKALKLVQEYGRIEAMPDSIREVLGDVNDIRRLYLEPDVTDQYDISPGDPDLPGILDFLCGEREFSKDRVTAAIDRAFRNRSLW